MINAKWVIIGYFLDKSNMWWEKMVGKYLNYSMEGSEIIFFWPSKKTPIEMGWLLSVPSSLSNNCLRGSTEVYIGISLYKGNYPARVSAQLWDMKGILSYIAMPRITFSSGKLMRKGFKTFYSSFSLLSSSAQVKELKTYLFSTA